MIKKVIHKVIHILHNPKKKGAMLVKTEKELKNFFEREDIKKMLKS